MVSVNKVLFMLNVPLQVLFTEMPGLCPAAVIVLFASILTI
jgi:hypothetical protein